MRTLPQQAAAVRGFLVKCPYCGAALYRKVIPGAVALMHAGEPCGRFRVAAEVAHLRNVSRAWPREKGAPDVRIGPCPGCDDGALRVNHGRLEFGHNVPLCPWYKDFLVQMEGIAGSRRDWFKRAEIRHCETEDGN